MISKEEAIEKIPHNEYYCYDHIATEKDKPEDIKDAHQLVNHLRPFRVVGLCPYLSISSRGRKVHPSGRCKFLDIADKDVEDDPAGYMLFDMIKCCGINTERVESNDK